MNYAEIMNYIEEKSKLGSIPGLVHIQMLLEELGNPQLAFPVVHIAGTNGKGSIMAFFESICIQNGYQVGRYISPTIFEYRERFTLNKTYISEEECAEILSETAEAVERVIARLKDPKDPGPTAFEIETAASFLYFKKHHVDVALVECGMGGRLDATNVFPFKVVDVIASISRDHMGFLGETIEDITYEKMGIVRDNDFVVSYPQTETVMAAMECILKAQDGPKNVEFCMASAEDVSVVKQDITQTAFIYKGESYEIRLVGNYQIANAITAIETVNAWNAACVKRGIPLPAIEKEALKKGLKDTIWEGRFQVIGTNPLFIVDGAHNEDAWVKLRENVNKYFTKKQIIYIIGILRDKEIHRMIEELSPTMGRVFTITTDSPRAYDGALLAKRLQKIGVEAIYCENRREAVRLAKESAKSDDVIIACGSLSFVGEIIRNEEA